MTQEPDYYAVLQVDPRAEPEVIQAAYRRLAAKYHPDVDPSPNAMERMKLLNSAYEVVADPDRRRSYDVYRQSPRGPSSQTSHPRRLKPRSWSSWWLLPALVAFVVAFRFSPRFALVLGFLFLLLWLFKGRR